MTFSDQAEIQGVRPPEPKREPAQQKFPKPEYLVRSKVRALAAANGRRVSAEFLHVLDLFIKHKVEKACRAHNGGKKTLDATIAAFVGVK